MASVFDSGGTARLSLREIVADYGVVALDDERLVTSILTDLLAGHPREATLIRAAARLRVAELLRAHAGNRIPIATAVEDVSARLGHESLIEPTAARWIVSEYAIALGQLTPEGAVPAPAQGVARVAVPEPPPTMTDAAPPAPVSGAAAVAAVAVPVAEVPATAPPSPRQPETIGSDPRASDPRGSEPRGSEPRGPDPRVGIGPPVPAVPVTADAGVRPTVLATVLAVVLPIGLGLVMMLTVPAVYRPVTYAGGLHGQWLMVLLPMTLTLVAVTAAMRAGARAWLATGAYVVVVYLCTVAVPLIGDTESGATLFHDLNLSSLRQSMEILGISGDFWLFIAAIALTALTHAVMKRLGLVRRVGLLAFVLVPVIALLANSIGTVGYYFVFVGLHGATSDEITGALIELALFMNISCVVAILLARVPKLAGRR